MPKLSEYVEMAAVEYFQEMGTTDLDSRWIAEFFQNNGVLDDYPRQDLVAFAAMVQKTLTIQSERADKEVRTQLDKIAPRMKRPYKP